MKDILFYTGMVIVLAATIALLVFAVKQNALRRQVKDIPLRYEEWRANYRTRRWYYCIAQIAGIVIAIIGLMV